MMREYVSRARLNDIIGKTSADVFLKKHAGSSFYVKIKTDPDLIELLGFEAAQKLCDWFAGTDICLPSRRQATKTIVQKLRQSGKFSNREIAQKAGVTERRVYQILADQKPCQAAEKFQHCFRFGNKPPSGA